MTFEIRTADQLTSAAMDARRTARRAARRDPTFTAVLRAFVDGGGPVSVADVARQLPGSDVDAARAALRVLDAADLLVLDGDAVTMAYPFSAIASPFAVDFGDGRPRYACCAIDALGLAPMVGRPVVVESRCHDCAEPFSLRVTPAGPVGGDGMLVWVGERPTGGRICTSL
jgi:hypothetical protein